MRKRLLIMAVLVFMIVFLTASASFAGGNFSEERRQQLYSEFKEGVNDFLEDLLDGEDNLKIIQPALTIYREKICDEILIFVFLKDDQENRFVWAIEERRLNEKTVDDFAERAAHIIYFYLPEETRRALSVSLKKEGV